MKILYFDIYFDHMSNWQQKKLSILCTEHDENTFIVFYSLEDIRVSLFLLTYHQTFPIIISFFFPF